ncbi:hypothetical protein CPter91_1708 [Collimonas pratensis]|uniref:Uncharacterized protein n=1 Tax=Collimonas pratensis TaxID=279113 RepID=A0A127Q221_9BURK|nr:hypothetical protein CPter91_1708 [Collimonas pratensis]
MFSIKMARESRAPPRSLNFVPPHIRDTYAAFSDDFGDHVNDLISGRIRRRR